MEARALIEAHSSWVCQESYLDLPMLGFAFCTVYGIYYIAVGVLMRRALLFWDLY